MDWLNLITSVGFPIVACGAMACYVKDLTSKHREEVKELNAEHRAEMKEMTIAVENNTQAINQLCIMLRKGDDGIC